MKTRARISHRDLLSNVDSGHSGRVEVERKDLPFDVVAVPTENAQGKAVNQ
jgi:hypothetical protein